MSPSDDDDVEVMVIRGPGAKTFLSQLGELSGEAEDDDEEFDEVEDEDGRVWRSAKAKDSGRGKLKVKEGGKDDDQPQSFGAKFFGSRSG